MPKQALILLEFNELTPTLMARFRAGGHLPNFDRLHRESQVFLTEAQEETRCLEPWIQWVTVHCGMPFAAHGVFDLGEGAALRFPRIWDLVSSHGGRVWVCGSMNPGPQQVNGLLLPDPWSRAVRPSDPSLEPYHRFVREHVLEYTRPDRVPLGPRDYLSFVRCMLRNGLRAQTCLAVLHQLLSERVGDTAWRRATILDRLQFDLFRAHYRRLRPDFATFFLNSTAHYQHVYWRSMDPEQFTLQTPGPERGATATAIRFGYEQMDRLLGDLFALVGDDTIIAFATALSQQPCTRYDATGGKTFHRLVSLDALLGAAGIAAEGCRLEPVMSEEFHLRFDDAEHARTAHAALALLAVDGSPVLKVRRSGADVFAGCAVHREIAADREVSGCGRPVRFGELFYRVQLTKSGMHHPLGMLWVRVPGMPARRRDDPVPLVDVAPTLLSLMDVPVPAHLPGEPLIRRTAPRRTGCVRPPAACRSSDARRARSRGLRRLRGLD